MLTLHNLSSQPKKKKRRYGRGNSKRGSYSGRGIKGQRSRTGGRKGLKLRGLKQSFLGIPKMGGFSSLRQPYQVVNLSQLEKIFPSDAEINPAEFRRVHLLKDTGQKIKILGGGKLTKKFTITAHAISKSALQTLQQHGGEFKVIKAKSKISRPQVDPCLPDRQAQQAEKLSPRDRGGSRQNVGQTFAKGGSASGGKT